MSHTRNTRIIEELHEAWATLHGYRTKVQAPSNKLDKSFSLGYHRSQGQARDGQAIDICKGPLMGPRNSAAEILQQRPVKSPARGRNGSCRIMVPGERLRGRSHKRQAASRKRQAPSAHTIKQQAFYKSQAK